MVIGALARKPAIAKDMAIRWSPCDTTSPPPMLLLLITMPSSVGTASTPRICKPSAMTWIRSLSLTRSSFAPVNRVCPSAQAAAINRIGNSSIAKGTRCSGMSIPCNWLDRMCKSATGSPPMICLLSISILAPINCKISMMPVRVGLIPT